jgi:hypothetical protein
MMMKMETMIFDMASDVLVNVQRMHAAKDAIGRMTIKRSTDQRVNFLRVIQFQKFYNEELAKRNLPQNTLEYQIWVDFYRHKYRQTHVEGLF